MIITRVNAENVLKYQHLELDELPTPGLIAISGENESGKSSIGETICFALFGRTYSFDAQDAEKLIRWGASRCNASLDFRVGEGATYRVSRYLDREGTRGARLARLDHEEITIAKGIDHVNAAVCELVGFNYDEFIDSFYLAQRELSAPQAHSDTVMTMAGIMPLVAVRRDLEAANNKDRQALREAEEKLAETEAEISALGFEEGRLENLQKVRQELGAAQSGCAQRADELKQATITYHEHRGSVEAARQSRRRNAFGFLVFLIAAVAVWTGWGMLTWSPQQPFSMQLQQWLSVNAQPLQPGNGMGLVAGAVIVTLLALFFAIRTVRLRNRIGAFQRFAAQLAQQLGDVRHLFSPEVAAAMGKSSLLAPGPGVATAGNPDSATHETGTEADFRLPDDLETVATRVKAFDATPSEVNETVEGVNRALLHQSLELKQHLARLDPAIKTETDRREEARRLQTQLETYQARHTESGERLRLGELQVELVDGAAGEMSRRFNRDVRALTSKALPLFTQGHYEHVQIDENLEVRVFSGEKNDFMEFDEISSGTQRQIMLALRLALSQELLRTTGGAPQFVFLDEPFAFFDQHRMLATLHALPQISEDLTQTWIIAQHLPDESRVDRHIQCDRAAADLCLNA